MSGENYTEIAQAFSAVGVRVDDIDQVGPALKAAIDAQMNDGKTTVIEIMCAKELGDPFRKDALSTPVRHLAKGAGRTERPLGNRIAVGECGTA